MSQPSARIVFVGGLSGSGRSTAMGALEDLGFYGVDNLPPQLSEQFVDLCRKASPPILDMALAIDAREEAFLRGFPEVVETIRAGGARVEVLFLDCADQVLVNRYRETRRVHPLAPAGTVEQGIARERTLLEDVARLADWRLDTSQLNIHQLRESIVRLVTGAERRSVVNLVSFGYRYGIPPAAELLFDVRFLPNPHFEPALRPRTGRDVEVAKYVLEDARTQDLLKRLRDFLDYLFGFYDAEGKAYLTIGIGCTGGRHRSVAVADALAEGFRAQGRDVNVRHRDVEKELG
ncbi:RNase adapter RapZ [Myxococcota bacterium]|nr:RNase adapter RapZ [Myxococcota bacterium]MCZ7619048.1 RNase adapter RapZ [Myxococcota bacterium]